MGFRRCWWICGVRLCFRKTKGGDKIRKTSIFINLV